MGYALFVFLGYHKSVSIKYIEVLSMLEDDHEQMTHASSVDIFICPPSNPNCSDKNSGDDEAGGNYNNISGEQLPAEATATIRMVDGSSVGIEAGKTDDDDDGDEDQDIDQDIVSSHRKQKKQTKAPPPVRKWVKADLPIAGRHEPEVFTNQYENLDFGPAALYKLFLTMK